MVVTKGEKMKTYKEHYDKCRENYTKSIDEKSNFKSAYDMTIAENVIEKNEEYVRLVDVIAQKVSKKFDEYEGCFRDQHAVRLNDWHDIEEIAEFADLVMPQIEAKVFKSNLKVEFVHPYRNLAGQKNKTSSWLWHYDDCPPEFLKLVLYLNEVTEKSGCFEYISDPKGEVPKIKSSRIGPQQRTRQVFPSSRVPEDVVSELLEEGYSFKQLVGGKGTCAVLTPNVIHRGTIPDEGVPARDAIFFFIRPVLEEQEEYVDEDTHSYLPEKNVKEYTLD